MRTIPFPRSTPTPAIAGIATGPRRPRLRPLSAALLLAGCTGLPAWACDGPAARLVSKEGVVELRPLNQADWRPATVDQPLCAGDTLAVRRLGRAAVVLPNDVVLRLDQGSVLTLSAFAADRPSELGLLQGALHVLTRFTKRFGVVTPYLNAMVDGTEFTVKVEGGATSVSVTEGRVRAANAAGEQQLTAGLGARAGLDQPPTALTLRPADAVQWALYFPQVVQPTAKALQALSPAARAAVQQAADGRFTEALTAWPENEADLLRPARAGWLLALGRVEDAEALLSGQEGDADALAVRSVIQVIRHRQADAEGTALRAAAMAPDNAAPQLALSHALQAGRDLPAALEAARDAVAREARQPLAWARLAELQLSSGLLGDGEASARRATALNPRTPRAQALLGFAQLLRGRLAPARESLLAAQADFPADPLPHLGLGLVHLRSGHLAEARREIEVAVMLDPGNAELRAWLARAYQREGRDRLSTDQLDLSRSLDPRSPTPWFIDGMRKQRANRPVEAAGDFERALELNDQRAVVRPDSLLDTDRAARTAALAGVWRDLGFDDRLRSAARTALVGDSQNAAAHRLLADAYAGSPRNESARVSELLQAQLRQSPRTAPVAPQELVPGLPVQGGPRALSLQEAGPLFDESRGGARLGLLAGNRGVWGTAASAWVGVGDGQLSVGHFHYESDGFRPDADVSLNANNLLWQTAVTPELNAQVELRETRRRAGEITQRLVQDAATPQNRSRFDSQAARIGLRYAPTVEREWLGSFVWSRRDSSMFDVVPNGPAVLNRSADARQKGKLAELMYADRSAIAQWSIGVSGYREDRDEASATDIVGLPFPVPTQFENDIDKARHNIVFGYGSVRPDRALLLSGGLAFDHYARGPVDTGKMNAKLGLAITPSPDLTLRAAAYETTKGSVLKEQSIEPTQFNGFNQLFDDTDGTRARQFGLGLDHRIDARLAWGGETLFRRLDIPSLAGTAFIGCSGAVCTIKAKEDLYRVYVNARLAPRWALNLSLQNEAQHLLTSGQPFQMPGKLETWQLPVRASYFSPAGWSTYAQLRAVRQTASDADPAKAGSARFTLADFGAKYQPERRNFSVLLDVANAFDKNFQFQNTYINGDPRIPLFEPGRSVKARVELRF
jgi:hypothetical protein